MTPISYPGSFLACAALLLAPLAAQDPKLPKDPHQAVVELPLQQPVTDGHPVQVVDEKNEPLQGVSVVVVDTKKVSRSTRRAILTAARKKYPGDAEAAQLALLALHGKRWVTDAKGETKFARAARGLVVAIKGRTIAVSTVILRAGREPRRFQMILKPKPGIDVIVVDHRNRPVRNVPVRLIWRTQHGSSWGEMKSSGAGGRVRFKEVGENHYGPDWAPYIEARIPAKKRIGVKLNPKTFKNDPANPIKLKLPPFGMVRVYVVDDKKRAVKGVEAIHLRPLNQEDHDHDTFTANDVKGDYATFHIVEVGLQFEATCRYKGQSRPQKVMSDGPRHPMDMRVVTIEGVTAPRVLSFKLLDQKGEPVKREKIGVIMTVPNYMSVRSLSTDKNGVCKVTLTERFDDLEDGVLTVTRRGKGRKLVYKGAARKMLDGAEKNPDLGELRLQDEALLVAGRVVDADGKPVAGVYISTKHGYRPGNRGGSSTSGESKFHQHRMRTDKEGRFEFREIDADPVTVTLSLDSWMSHGRKGYYIIDGEDADPGAKEHKVVVGETSEVTGSFVGLPKGASFDGSIELHQDGHRSKNGWIYTRGDGTFKQERCPPGEYDMVFKFNGAQKPFLEVKGIKVEPGKPCKDARLQKIDLSKYCHVVKITVLKPDKTPAAGTTVWRVTLKDGRARTASGNSTNQDGELVICAPLDGAYLSVMPSDGLYRAQQFEAVKKDLTVHLKPGWRTKFKIKNWPKKLPPNLRFSVSYYIRRGDKKAWGMSLSPSRTTRYLGTNGEVELSAGSSGDYRLSLSPYLTGRVQRRLERIRGANLQFEVKVAEKAKGLQMVELELDEDALATIEEYAEMAKEKSNGK